MKIYFSCSIRGIRPEPGTARKLIDHLRKHGTVLTEQIGEITGPDESELTDAEIFSRDVAWLGEADAVVAEVTGPSLGVGYEIGMAEALGKPVLCLHRGMEGRRLSAMIRGNGYLALREYGSMPEACGFIDEFFGSFA